MTSEKSKRILIVGSGVTGTALAALLEKQNVSVDVVEKMSNWHHDGYGITIMAPGLEVLHKLGLVTAVRKQGTSANNFDFLDPNGHIIRKFKLKTDGTDSVTLDRAGLHKLLLSKLKSIHIRMGTTIASIAETNEGALLTFSDGSQTLYDLVIGADGVRSVTRSLIFPDVNPKFAGAAIWTFFLPPDVYIPTKKDVMQVWNDDEFMGIFPIKEGAAVTFSMPLEDSEDLNKFDLNNHFKDIDFLAHDILEKVKNEDMYAGYLNEMTLGEWHKGHVVLAGDAAHAMMPATGMGASMGLQDALCLSNLISKTGDADWNKIPQTYQKERKTIVDRVQHEAYLVGRLMFLKSPFKNGRNEVLKLIPQFVVSHQLQRKP